MSCATPLGDLELLAYGFLPDEASDTLERHMDGCPRCGAVFEELVAESTLVGFGLSVLEPMDRDRAPRPSSPLLPAALISAAALLLIGLTVTLLLTIPGPVPEDDEAPGRGRNPIVVQVDRDSDPELIRRIQELTDRIRELTSTRPAESPTGPGSVTDRPPEPDWREIARTLLDLHRELRLARWPRRSDPLRRYLRALEGLSMRSNGVSVPTSLAEAMRDPRFGPRIFGEMLRAAWPDAAETDLVAARDAARERIRGYRETVAADPSIASWIRAEEALAGGLSTEIATLVDRWGRSGLAEEILPTMAIPEVTNLVLDGSRDEIIHAVVRHWRAESGAPDDLEPAMSGLASRWVDRYAQVLAMADPEARSAFDAYLDRRDRPGSLAPASAVTFDASPHAPLREALLALQQDAEEMLSAILEGPARARFDARIPTPVYFRFD